LPKTNLTNSIIEVYVVGEVNNPGKIKIETGTQLNQAVFFAGGPKNIRANKNKVQLVRTNANGSMTFKKYNINLSQRKSNSTPVLKDGDIINVTPTAISTSIDILTETTKPVLNVFTLYKLFE